jgi:hypothetical protein
MLYLKKKRLVYYFLAAFFILRTAGICSGWQFSVSEGIFADDEQHLPVIVFGDGLEEEGRQVQKIVNDITNRWLPSLADEEVMEGNNWRFHPFWIERPMVLVGNVENNRGMLALLSHYLAGAHSGYPGEGRYVIRTVFQPFRPGVHILVLGASDSEGLDIGIARLESMIKANGGVFAPTVEIGDAQGVISDFSMSSTRGPSSRNIQEFRANVYNYHWYGDKESGEKARQNILAELEKSEKGLWNFHRTSSHSTWTSVYRPLRQLLASGLLSEEELREVERRMIHNVLDARDYHIGHALRAGPGRWPYTVESAIERLYRHELATLAGIYVILEYLNTVAENIPEKYQKELSQSYRTVLGHIEHLLEREHVSHNDDQEGFARMAKLSDIYFQYGDSRFVAKDILRHMADASVIQQDNLPSRSHAGQDTYYSCRPGTQFGYRAEGQSLLLAALMYRDGQYRWLADAPLRHGICHQANYSYPPEYLKLGANIIPAEEPDRLTGLVRLRLDPWFYLQASGHLPPTYRFQETVGGVADDVRRVMDAPYEKTYHKFLFREGFGSDDAYLIVQGMNPYAAVGQQGAGGYNGNSVIRYTEFGSLLLYANTMRHSSWARSVVSSSRGEHDPQSTTCIVEEEFDNPVAGGVTSVKEYDGGVRWSRSIIRRWKGYFLVLDELQAHYDDIYNLTCRWRSYHQGEMESGQVFEAKDRQNGVTFRIMSAEPVHWDVTYAERDGAARPTVVSQMQQAGLKKREGAYFSNLVYASQERQQHFEIKKLADGVALIKGSNGTFSETAAAGKGKAETGDIILDAGLWHISKAGLSASGFCEFRFSKRVTISVPSGEEDIQLFFSGNEVVIKNTGETPRKMLVGTAGRVTTHSITPGEHKMELPAGNIWDNVERQLAGLWEKAETAGSIPPAELKVDKQVNLSEAWKVEGVRPDYAEYGGFTVSGDPPLRNAGTGGYDDSSLIDKRLNHRRDRHTGFHPGVSGEIILDMGREIDIHDIEFIAGQDYPSPRGTGRWFINEEEIIFHLTVSNDNFRQDIREKKNIVPVTGWFYNERQFRTYIYRYRLLTLPVEERARYVKIKPERVKGEGSRDERVAWGVYFAEVLVRQSSREKRIASSIVVDDFGLGRGLQVLYQAGSNLKMLSPEGNILWQADVGAPLAVRLKIADTDGDGLKEALVFTVAEEFAAYSAADGSKKFSVDLFSKGHGGGGYVQGFTRLRPTAFAAWRPDERGRLEYIFFPHYNSYRIGPVPELEFKILNRYHGLNQVAFHIPDVTVDGKEELVVASSRISGIPSDSPLEEGKLLFDIYGRTGHGSGNNELPLYHNGSAVKDAEGNPMGVFVVNPGGINYFSWGDFKPKWARFNHPANLCHLLADITGDGIPEILLGREDGYVAVYEVENGRMLGKAGLDGPVRALAFTGEYVIAGTENGLAVMDREMDLAGYTAGGVESIGTAEDNNGKQIIVASHSDGEIIAYRLDKQ